jgi:hypothetical protein
LNNLELAVNLAKRGNLPGAENLVSHMFLILRKKLLCVSHVMRTQLPAILGISGCPAFPRIIRSNKV